jgi:hypothetical protein
VLFKLVKTIILLLFFFCIQREAIANNMDTKICTSDGSLAHSAREAQYFDRMLTVEIMWSEPPIRGDHSDAFDGSGTSYCEYLWNNIVAVASGLALSLINADSAVTILEAPNSRQSLPDHHILKQRQRWSCVSSWCLYWDEGCNSSQGKQGNSNPDKS